MFSRSTVVLATLAIIGRPDGTLVASGAALNAPECVRIDAPAPGNWIACMDGFTVATSGGDRFKLQILVDGRIVK